MVANYEFELFEREDSFSDKESIADSVEFYPYISYDEDMAEFLDREDDWMFEGDGDEDISHHSANSMFMELPDYVEEEKFDDNITPDMSRVLNRLYPGDLVEYSYV